MLLDGERKCLGRALCVALKAGYKQRTRARERCRRPARARRKQDVLEALKNSADARVRARLIKRAPVCTRALPRFERASATTTHVNGDPPARLRGRLPALASELLAATAATANTRILSREHVQTSGTRTQSFDVAFNDDDDRRRRWEKKSVASAYISANTYNYSRQFAASLSFRAS